MYSQADRNSFISVGGILSSPSFRKWKDKKTREALPVGDSLWSVGHAEARQVSVGEGEQGHDGDEGAVVAEEDGESGVLDVTQHEQRDEDQTRQHGGRKQNALLRGLREHQQSRSVRINVTKAEQILGAGGRLTHWTRDGALRPTKSMALKTMKQQTQVNTLSVRAGG